MNEIPVRDNTDALSDATTEYYADPQPTLLIEWPEETDPSGLKEKWIALKAPDDAIFEVHR